MVITFSYTLVTHDRAGREHSRPYTSKDSLAPASVVLLAGRYWLVERLEQTTAQARPARYRLTLRHPDGRLEAGAFRRFRTDAPTVGHQLTTLEAGAPASWAVVEQRLARDAAGDPFLELIAERDYTESESLLNHQLEHTLDQERNDTSVAAAVLARATEAGRAIELVGLEAGEAPDWDESTRYLDSLILEELEDDLIEQCGVDTRHDPPEAWLDRVKQRLHDDLDSLRADIEGPHDQVEEWDFHGGRIFAAVGSFADDSNPLSGYGWLCRLVDASVLQAGGFYRARKPLLPL
jgi:hypothetical protein